MNVQLSVSEIVQSAASLAAADFEQLYQSLSRLRSEKQKIKSQTVRELELLALINMTFEKDKWERLRYLDWKLENQTLNASEEQESLTLAEAYEAYSVQRLQYMVELALLRQVSLDALIEELTSTNLTNFNNLLSFNRPKVQRISNRKKCHVSR